jgi:hypothetical protein
VENRQVGVDEISGPALEYFVLTRLERFAARLTDPRVEDVPAWQRLARQAVSTALQDCIALGLGAEALVILEDAQSPV